MFREIIQETPYFFKTHIPVLLLPCAFSVGRDYTKIKCYANKK